MPQPRRRDEFFVWEDNRAAAELFLALSTQWRTAGMDGVPTGLDYAAIPATARMRATKMTPALFADIRLMEHAALDAWAEQRRREPLPGRTR